MFRNTNLFILLALFVTAQTSRAGEPSNYGVCSWYALSKLELETVRRNVRYLENPVEDLAQFLTYVDQVENAEKKILEKAYKNGKIVSEYEKTLKDFHTAVSKNYTGYMRDQFNADTIHSGLFVSELGDIIAEENPNMAFGAKFWFAPINTLNVNSKDSAKHLGTLLEHREKEFRTEIEGIIEEERPFNEISTADDGSLSYVHDYPNVSDQESYILLSKAKLSESIALVQANASQEKILHSIADFYHVGINAHLFQRVNNTILMAYVNLLLKKVGLKTVHHGILDYQALIANTTEFRQIFAAHVNAAQKI